MKPYQERVVIEHRELLAKYAALYVFIQTPDFLSLPHQEKALLRTQRRVMGEYLSVLADRVSLFEKAASDASPRAIA